MGKMWLWTRSKGERCGCGQGLNGKDADVNKVKLGKIWLWARCKWERCGCGQALNGKYVAVDKL